MNSLSTNFLKTIRARECQTKKNLDDNVKVMKRHSKKVIEEKD